VLYPYFRFVNIHEFIVGLCFQSGQNTWRPWFGELRLHVGYWEFAIGLGYKPLW
jgi:hypothetical protein